MQSLKQLTEQTPSNGNAWKSKYANAFLVDSISMSVMSSHEEISYGEKFSNKAIICSIHQPTSEVFEFFTHVIVMHAGRIAFQGTVAQANIEFARYYYFSWLGIEARRMTPFIVQQSLHFSLYFTVKAMHVLYHIIRQNSM